MNISETIAVPVYAFGIVVLLVMTLCGSLGYAIANSYVEPRNNLGHFFGAIFGLLLSITVGLFFAAWQAGIVLSLVTFIYTISAMHLQRG